MLDEQVRRLAASQTIETQRYLCPACSAERRHNKERCLSVTVDDERLVWLCQHCGFKGAARLEERRFPDKTPVVMPSPVSNGIRVAEQWLARRGIDPSLGAPYVTCAAPFFRDSQSHVAIGFVYPDATKWRALDDKLFTQTGSAQTMWRLEKIPQGQPLVITEGEVDALSLLTAGIEAVSVPNGAPQQVSRGLPSPREDKKFGYIWQAKEHIERAPKIILALDADTPGEALGEEIARRIGRAKCWRVQWPSDCKDANDVLVRHGKEILRRCVEEAKPWPVKGLYDAAQFFDKVDALYDRGLPKGESTGFANLDELYSVVPGQLTVLTGSPGSGKSSWLDNVMVNLARERGWKFAICSFENPPELHIANLMSIATGRPFFDGPTPRMTEQMKADARAWINEHFFFLHQSDGSLSALDEIIDLTKTAVMRYGVRGLVVDPYNYLERSGEKTETDWVSDALTRLKLLSMAHDLHTWLVAHPTKMRRRDDGTYPVPTGYDISGSAAFFAKADMGVTVHRPDPAINKTEVHTWKVRYRFTGQLGSDSLSYDIVTGVFWSPVR